VDVRPSGPLSLVGSGARAPPVPTRVSIRIFLCDDVPELRALLRFALEEDGDVRVVGEAGDAATGVRQIAELHPDVVLLDLSMPGMDGLEAIPLIREQSPATRIIVFSGFAADRMRDPALELGAQRYMEKGAPLEDVRAAIRELAETGPA
jgi:DNA-binding NarL/FixJ family response regulator